MPRSTGGVKRPAVDVQSLKEAIEDVHVRKLSIGVAAKNHGISKTTLLRHLKAHTSSGDKDFQYKSNINVKQIFTEEEEVSLVNYLKVASRLHYGLTKRDTRILAYQFARENKQSITEKWNNEGIAGKEWLRGFLQRHKTLSLRKPEATSLARSTSFNKKNVGDFFTNLKACLSRDQFDANKIYNLDETGNSTVHVPPKIIAPRGAKQVGSMTSGERGINVTMIAAINAVGNHVPPMLIFPRVHFKNHMLKGAPPGSIGGANPSGWSNEDLFVEYLNHFIKYVKPTINEKVLLIIDNHDTHISIPAITLAKNNGIILLTLPPHTSHKLQPLDRTVFGPYKAFYNQAASEWMLSNPGKPMGIYDVAEIVGKAYGKAFTIENIVKGFTVTGICPLNENIFSDNEFLTSYVTDRPYDASNGGQNVNNIDNRPSCSTDLPFNHNSDEPRASVSFVQEKSYAAVSPEMVRPYPKALPRKSRGGRQKGRTRILTDTPEKEDVEKKKQNRVKPKVSYPKRKKCRLTCSSKEDLDEELILQDSSDGSEFAETLFELHRSDDEKEEATASEVSIGDFVLVELAGKKTKSIMLLKF